MREVSDDNFVSVFGAGRGPAASPIGAAPQTQEALDRAARLAEAGGIAAVLVRARESGGKFDAVEYLRGDLADVADELFDWAVAEGAGVRSELARLLDAPDVRESYSGRLQGRVHDSVLRNCACHDESWLRARALLAHDEELGRRIESDVIREGRALWLVPTDEEERQLKLRLFDRVSDTPPVRADWKVFVPELRAHRSLDRLRPTDLRVLWEAHLRERFERAARLQVERARRAPRGQ